MLRSALIEELREKDSGRGKRGDEVPCGGHDGSSYGIHREKRFRVGSHRVMGLGYGIYGEMVFRDGIH